MIYTFILQSFGKPCSCSIYSINLIWFRLGCEKHFKESNIRIYGTNSNHFKYKCVLMEHLESQGSQPPKRKQNHYKGILKWEISQINLMNRWKKLPTFFFTENRLQSPELTMQLWCQMEVNNNHHWFSMISKINIAKSNLHRGLHNWIGSCSRWWISVNKDLRYRETLKICFFVNITA